VRRNEDRLRTIILDTKDAEYWSTHFDLTERPEFEAKAVDVEQAVKTALEKRTDLLQSRKNIEIANTSIRYQRNQTLPDLNGAGWLWPQRAGRHEAELRSGLPRRSSARSTKASAR